VVSEEIYSFLISEVDAALMDENLSWYQFPQDI
jgi:hypothetical protein